MISEALTLAIWRYRSRGGRLYKLAIAAGMTPSMLSATLSGLRRVVDGDTRVIAIGEQLGLEPSQCFEADPNATPAAQAAPDRAVAL